MLLRNPPVERFEDVEGVCADNSKRLFKRLNISSSGILLLLMERVVYDDWERVARSL